MLQRQRSNYFLLWALLWAQSFSLLAQTSATLSGTGLYSDITSHRISPHVREYDVQYPLWSDGEMKRRWIQLPVGEKINSEDGNWWKLPVGTKLWKEFSYIRDGKLKRIETRLTQNTSSGWEFKTYLWNEDDTEAKASNGELYFNYVHLGEGVYHHVPGNDHCLVCHNSKNDIAPVIGFSALQLDHQKAGVKLQDLKNEGLLTHRLPDDISIKGATPEGTKALGLMHGNCGHCHNPTTYEANLGLLLNHDIYNTASETENGVRTTVNQESRYSFPDAEVSFKRILPGNADGSVLYRRVKSSNHLDPFHSEKMPPGILGTMTENPELMKSLKIWINSLKTKNIPSH